MIKIKSAKYETLLAIYLICYFLVNLLFLKQFPFVHSDEAWLSGLTRNMIQSGDLGVTETFYDLKPRYPHAIKLIFHLLQMTVLTIFNYDIFSFRLLSLFFGCLSLLFFYLTLKSLLRHVEDLSSGWYPLLGTFFLSLDVQFIYASHFARQEIVLVLFMIICIYAITVHNYLMAAIFTGLAIGIHPNSFLIGMMCVAILIPHEIENAKSTVCWKPLAIYSAVTGAITLFFIGISFYFDRNFITHYLQYGSGEFDIDAPISNKIAEFPYFIEKIWFSVSGTYYVPNIKLELILFLITAIASVLFIVSGARRNRAESVLILKGLAGMLLGMMMIGRYNQTSIVLIFPLFFILILLMVDSAFELLPRGRDFGRNLTILCLALFVGITSYINITPWLAYSYDDYIGDIAKAVKPGDKVLANLNAEYYFENGKLLDYRNLPFLEEEGMTVEEYIEKNDIEYIILSDEMDLIYSKRPTWNMIYGNPMYMEELHEYIKAQCIPVSRFKNNTYGVRIVQFMNSDRDFTIQIFKVKDFS